MEPFDSQSYLDATRFEPEAFNVIIEATQLAVAPKTRSLKCKLGHLLLALFPTLQQHEEWRDAFESGLKEGGNLWNVPALIETYLQDTEDEPVFELKAADFDHHVLAALAASDQAKDAQGKIIWEANGRPVSILALWAAVLSHPSEEDRQWFSIMDFARTADAFAQLLVHSDQPEREISLPSLFSSEGQLLLEQFDDAAVAALEAARERAGSLGHGRIYPPHLFLALLERPDGITEQILRLQARLEVGPATVSEALLRAISLGPGAKPKSLNLDRYHLAETLQTVIRDAQLLALRNSADTIGERFLLRAVLASEREGMVGRCLSSDALGFNLDFMLRDVDKRIRDQRLGKSEEAITPFLIPGAVAKSEDLTYLARTGQLHPSVAQDALLEAMLRGLYKRQDNHLLITGEAGVGKTTLVRELGRRVGEGQIPFLKRKKIVWVNCDGIPPDQSRERFYAIVAAVKGRNDVIVCLDHFENIVRFVGTNESHNRAIIRVALQNRDIHLIAILDNRYYVELLSQDYGLLQLFNRVEVEEVSADQTITLLKERFVSDFKKLYGLDIEERAISRAAYGAHEFIMSERLPVKAIKVLRDACERVSYEREANSTHDARVKDEDVVWVLSQRTGIEEGTISGAGTSVDFFDVLSRHVVGQEEAVRAVALQLRKIKHGQTRMGKPAAVLLFAGLTGTGKTELAKAIARVYSASGRLLVYPMTNFTEDHSVSGITGVPPGYVGYESGGRLINDLNADPYGVVLFDEAEKAHPVIWQSMLSLFDEAWIEDRRNIRAYGNRSIFILTSNAEQDYIRTHYKTVDLEKLKQEVAKKLVDYRNERGERVFSPEFLGRFSDIIIFSPLSEQAMRDITCLQVNQLIQEWQIRQNKPLYIDEAVIDFIGRRSYQENERSGGTRGGRIVAQYLATTAESKLLDAMDSKPFKEATEVKVLLNADNQVEVDVLRQVSSESVLTSSTEIAPSD